MGSEREDAGGFGAKLTRLSRLLLSVPPSDTGWHGVMRPAVRQTIRVLVSVAVAGAVGTLLHLPELLWALITALIVTQSSIVQTLATARDQVRGTVLGGIAGAIALLLSVWTHWLWVPYWMLLVPLVFLAAIQNSLRFACITLTIIFLVPSPGGLFVPLFNRLLAIVIGVVVSMGVSFLVLHGSARRQAFHAAARLLRGLNDMLAAALDPTLRWSEIEERNQRCVSLLTQVQDAVAEARRERLRDLKLRDPVLAALPTLLRRLVNDTTLVARAITTHHDDHEASLGSLYDHVNHALRTLAHVCDQERLAPHKRHPHQPDPQDILRRLPDLEERMRPEIRFVMSLFRADIDRAVRVIVSRDMGAMDGL